MRIVIDSANHYVGGHYFGKVKIHKKYENTGGHIRLGKMKFSIVKGIGKFKEAEYWECDACYRN